MSEEFVSIDGLDVRLPWAVVENLYVLWSGPEARGSDIEIPGADGVLSFPRRIAITKRTLEIAIFGDFDTDGAPVGGDPRIGLFANIDTLRALTDPLEAGDGTRTLTLTLPDGSTRTAPVHCEKLELGPIGPPAVRATLDISIPGGVLL